MLKEIIEFSMLVGKLKKIERTGWKTWAKIENSESVADHIFRTAILGMIISDIKKMDTEKIVRMMLLHDLSEALMGDWDYYAKRKLGIEKKEQREKESFAKIISSLPKELRESYGEIVNELLDKNSEYGRLVKEIDYLEMAIQALEYEREGYSKERLDAFWRFHKNDFKDKDILNLFEMLEKERKL